MSLVAVRSILGLGPLPRHRATAVDWLRRHGAKIVSLPGNGGKRDGVHLSDLPAPVRLAYAAREAERAGLAPGVHDEAAHVAFAQTPATMRAKAERRAAVARFRLTIGKGLGWPEQAALAGDKFGPEGTLKRLLKAVAGVDPINFAPALLPGYGKSGPPSAEPSPEAWALFLSILQKAGEGYPLIAAWRDVEDLKGLKGWQWPSSATVRRRWDDLPLAARLHARIGTEAAVKRLAAPAMRDKTTIGPLEWVSLEGRTLDFWMDFGDGRAVRPVMIALVDVASSAVLGWALSTSENARSTQRVIREV